MRVDALLRHAPNVSGTRRRADPPGTRAAAGTIARGMQRIAITGIGSVSPVGLSTDEAWEALLAGHSGIAEITQFDASDMPIRVAGEVKGFDPVAVAGAKEARRMDRNVLLALVGGASRPRTTRVTSSTIRRAPACSSARRSAASTR